MCIEWSSCFQSTDTSILYLSSLILFQIKSMDMGAVMMSLRMCMFGKVFLLSRLMENGDLPLLYWIEKKECVV